MSSIKSNDPFEIKFELQDGEIVTVEGKAMPEYRGKVTIVGDCNNYYSYEEAERRGMAPGEIPWMLLPYGDLEFELSGGFVILRRDKEIVFMEMRDRIKKTVTLINGEVAGE